MEKLPVPERSQARSVQQAALTKRASHLFQVLVPQADAPCDRICCLGEQVWHQVTAYTLAV